MGNPKLMSNVMSTIKMPLPPLPIQSKIVEVLDNFTELTARKKQYEFYHNRLLAFGDNVPLVPLGEISTDMYRGAGIKRDEVTDDGTPCVRYGEIYTMYDIWFNTCVSRTKSGIKTFGHGNILFAIV
jgi:type I restriction enzyme S subunit